MPEFLIFVVASAVVGLAVWLLLAGDRKQDIGDEEPTLDTRGPEDR